MKKILISFAVMAGLSTSATAQENSLTTYSPHVDPHYVDVAPAGPSVGDQYMRRGVVMFDLKGPMVGEYYSQASLIFMDTIAKQSSRAYTHEVILPDGSIYTWDVVQTDHGGPVSAGHKHEGAIIGGTGKYAGVRGTYTLERMSSGDAFKTTYTYWLGQ
jgi:hypothetical protein